MIKLGMTYLKGVSVNALTQKERNVRATEPKFNAKNYSGINLKLLKVNDISTKILYYAEKDVKRIKQAIHILFKERFSFKLEDIYSSFSGNDDIYVSMALNEIIDSKEVIVDIFGISRILVENNGYVYLQSTLAEPVPYFPGIITSNLNEIENVFDIVASTMSAPIVNSILSLSPFNDKTFNSLIRLVDVMARISLAESAMSTVITTRQASELNAAIISKFESSFYNIEEKPKQVIAAVSSQLSSTAPVIGRGPADGKRRTQVNISNMHARPVNIDKLEEAVKTPIIRTPRGSRGGRSGSSRSKAEEADSSRVLERPVSGTKSQNVGVMLHTLKFQITNVNTDIRVFDMTETPTVWRNATAAEGDVYIKMIGAMETIINNKYFSTLPISGIIRGDKFYLINKEGSKSGYVCNNALKSKVLLILFRLVNNIYDSPGKYTKLVADDDTIKGSEQYRVFLQEEKKEG